MKTTSLTSLSDSAKVAPIATPGAGSRWDRRDWALLSAAGATALLVRLAYLAQVTFPPLDDPTFYLQTAANLVHGRGLVVDAIWSYQIPWSTITHPSHEHWMPVTTFLMAAAYKVFGVSLRSGQIPGITCGLALVALTYWLAKRALASRSLAFFAAVLIAISASLAYLSVSADSSMPFALLAAGAVCAIAIAQARRAHWVFALSGALIGLSYLTRSDGLLLWLLAVGLWWPLLRDFPRDWTRFAAAFGGFALFVGPWLVRNAIAFGTPVPGSALASMLQLDYTEQFNYPYALAVPALHSLLAVRAQALRHNLSALLLIGFPYAIVGVPGFFAVRNRVTRTGGWYLLGLVVALALVFPVPSLAGTFYHSVSAAMPFVAVATVGGIAWLSNRFEGSRRRLVFTSLAALVVLLIVGQGIISLRTVGEVHRSSQKLYAEASSWLVEHTHGPVVTSQPYTLNYVSGLPTVALPVGQPAEVAREVALRYGAEYLCITERFGLYPEALEGAAGFEQVHRGEGFEVYKVLP